MPKIPDCDGRRANRRRHRCLMCAHDYHLVCALHSAGPSSDNFPDFRPDPDLGNNCFKDFLNLQWQHQETPDADDKLLGNPFDLDPDEEQGEPEGAIYYNGKLIRQPSQSRIREEQLWLIDNHPLFTSVCPGCKYNFPQASFHTVHFDCPNCGWVDDSV